YDSWRNWTVLVPGETEARLALRLPELEKIAPDARVTTMRPGLHVVGLQIKPDRQSTSIQLRVDEAKQIFDERGSPADEQPKAPPIVRLLDPSASMVLAEVELTGAEPSVRLTVELP